MDNIEKMKEDAYNKGLLAGTRVGFLEGRELGNFEGKIEGSLQTLFQLFQEGILTYDQSQQKMKELSNADLDELVDSYLLKLKSV